jgi:ketosteroid isomerase-like protein
MLWPVSALVLSACAGMPGDPQGVHRGMERFATAFNQQDAAGVADVFEADAKLLPEGRPMLTGTDGIRAFWKGGFDAGLSHISKTPVEIIVSGDLAVETSHYVVTFKGQQISGKDTLVWRRGSSGDWKIVSDIWNSDVK